MTKKISWLMAVITLFFLVNGLNYFVSNTSSHSRLYDQRMGIVTTMINDIGGYAVKAGWRHVLVSADQIADYLIYPIQPFYYEMHGVLLNVSPALGATEINPETKASALSKLAKSQIFIANISGYEPSKVYPFEVSIAHDRALYRQEADKTFLILGEYRINNMLYRVYAKPG